MSSPDDHFARLVRLSRRATETAPPGALPAALATRVLAQLHAEERTTVSAWEWVSLRALPIAAAAAAVCVFSSDDAWSNRADDEQRLAQAMLQDQLVP